MQIEVVPDAVIGGACNINIGKIVVAEHPLASVTVIV